MNPCDECKDAPATIQGLCWDCWEAQQNVVQLADAPDVYQDGDATARAESEWQNWRLR